MDPATQLWTWWLSLLSPFVPVFTRPGWVRFVPWMTGMVWCWEEHTMTQMLTTFGLESRWRVLERFAEYGVWDREAVERHTLRLIEQEQAARWGQYHPITVDDSTRRRISKPVWGTCTFHEASARSPQSGRDGPGTQLGREGRLAARPVVDASAPCRAVVLWAQPTASGGDLPHQDGPGGGEAAASRCRVARADLGGV
jgi:hypothetical protein